MKPSDFETQVWAGVKAHAEARLGELRAALEVDGTTQDQAQAIRGAIKELKILLALAEPRPTIPSTSQPYS